MYLMYRYGDGHMSRARLDLYDACNQGCLLSEGRERYKGKRSHVYIDTHSLRGLILSLDYKRSMNVFRVRKWTEWGKCQSIATRNDLFPQDFIFGWWQNDPKLPYRTGKGKFTIISQDEVLSAFSLLILS